VKYQSRQMQNAYDGVARLQATDDCNICLVPWGTMHQEKCKFFKTNGESSGHCAQVVARFLRFVCATKDDKRLIAMFVMGMRRCSQQMGRDGVLHVIGRVNEITNPHDYRRRESEND
jgi:hypothetical protein